MNLAEHHTGVAYGAMPIDQLTEAAFDLHRAGRIYEAEVLYNQVLDRDPAELNALQLLGALASADGRMTEAVELLSRAAAILQAQGNAAEQHASLFYNLGNALKDAGRRPEAIEAYRAGATLAPTLGDLHASLAQELLADMDHAGAIDAYTTALCTAPNRTDWLHGLGLSYAGANRPHEAIAAYEEALQHNPAQESTLRALVIAILSINEPGRAIAPYTRLTMLSPEGMNNPVARMHLGKLQFDARYLDDARETFAWVLAAEPNNADAHYMMGRVSYADGNVVATEAYYRQAVALQPDHTDALYHLGVYLQSAKLNHAEAIVLYSRLLQINPAHADAYAAKGNAQRSLMQIDAALLSFRCYLELMPQVPVAYFQLGWTLTLAGQNEAAVPYLLHAIELDGPSALSHLAHIMLGNALQRMDRGTDALEQFRKALAYDIIARVATPPAGMPVQFSVLLILAPGEYNTPYEYLSEQDVYDANVLLLVPGFDYDVKSLEGRVDVVVNLVSDAEVDKITLPLAATLADQIGKPVVNHPGLVLNTDRESTARLLQGIPNTRVASISRHSGASLLANPETLPDNAPALPFLARCTGFHNGDLFEKVNTKEDLQALVTQNAEGDYFLIDYVDFASKDGYYRKYRFFFIENDVLPYHLAIGSSWKVHHGKTDMAELHWMMQEEKIFLDDPGATFGPTQMTALRQIRDTFGLDFFGIDCALDQDGNVVVFEVNATMLVHNHNAAFPYREPHVKRIKAAYNQMIAKKARDAMMVRALQHAL
jgi:tetratricopeptide (TPR) repeat protein